jgi:hypothetical protein
MSTYLNNNHADDIEMEPLVKYHMVPTSRFAKISDTATFSGAVMAMECAHDDFISGKREQITLLVTDANGNVTGKLSPWDLARGLTTLGAKETGSVFRGLFLVEDINADVMADKALHWSYPLDQSCENAKNSQIRSFILSQDATEIIGPEQNLSDALYRFAYYRHEILFVMDGKLVVGILRFDDIYKIIVKMTKSACRI